MKTYTKFVFKDGTVYLSDKPVNVLSSTLICKMLNQPADNIKSIKELRGISITEKDYLEFTDSK